MLKQTRKEHRSNSINDFHSLKLIISQLKGETLEYDNSPAHNVILRLKNKLGAYQTRLGLRIQQAKDV